MQIRAMYLKTIQRDRYDGTTQFKVLPMERYGFAAPYNDSALECIGKIQPYMVGMPIILVGEWDGCKFYVTDDQFDVKSDLGIDMMLSWASQHNRFGKLTVSQIDRIIAACNGNLFEFMASDDCIPVIKDICKRSKGYEDIVNDLVRSIRYLIHQQRFVTTLRQYNVPFDRIDKMIRKGVTLAEIRESPYIVMSRFDVPLQIVDLFARHECNMEPYARARCEGFVVAALRYLVSCGHTCCTMQQLVDTVNGNRYKKSLEGAYYGPSLINACILDLEKVCAYHTIDNQTYIYLNSTWTEESNAVHHIRHLQNSRQNYNTAITVDDTAAEIGINYNAGQRSAFNLLRTAGLKILTGPPGSGKTATINGLIRNFEANKNGTVHLAATTGMAARVMHAATGRDTETANAMLRVIPYSDEIRGRDLNDPVDADLIIVDEISMIGIQLFSILVGAARSGSIVILVGDENQLQSVEYGNVLHDLIASGEIEVCRLTDILRQTGTICSNAARVNAGDTNLDQDAMFAIKSVEADNIQHLLTSDYDPTKSQIISPIKKGAMGTFALNRMIQSRINSHSPVVAVYGKKKFRLGDKVVMTKNNYDAHYINGDIGYIKKALENGNLLVEFAGGTICIGKDDYCNMDLAYAITIHKSQGSEFPIVHIVLPEDGRMMMTRRLIYTAITRAKQKVIIYNQGSSLQDAIADRAEKPRVTMLKTRLQNYMQMR